MFSRSIEAKGLFPGPPPPPPPDRKLAAWSRFLRPLLIVMRFVPDAAGLRLVAQWDVEAPVVEDLVVLVQKHLAWEVGGKKS